MASSPLATFPPTHANRTIVLCFDGTQNQIGDKNSLAWLELNNRWLDLADDRICIFGFSRGAYTARALAAMLHKVGLLQRGNHRHIRYAWEAYTLTSEEGWKRAGIFKRYFGIEVDIEFIGVWDSVGSLGLNRFLPLTTNNTRIKAVRHALALDERRARYKANVWGVGLSAPEGTAEIAPPTNAKGTKMTRRSSQIRDDERRLLALGRTYIPTSRKQLQTDVLEVWFAGCHSDVGGGNTPTDVRHALSKISLRWMVRQCFLIRTGILFKEDSLRKIGLDPVTLYPVVLPRPPPAAAVSDKDALSEEEEDLLDLRCPIHDELKNKLAWWILEILPARKNYRGVDGDQKKGIE
ncbi:hypothetical protein Clacol_008424 [Clathrus columnatus]|uniref:T6SS Phospholipase effector Tle1-like catalytic domain-containing protein n=1 Tax=Clathrus columnatus TaxID=1419009 RepID=A0AAV5AM11_9AGAM|nr:hypothetical protein Clacol_008424 [Clathrus columnatus]